MAKSYTGKGDDGTTYRIGGDGKRTSKSDILTGAIGAVDELNACLGVVRAQANAELTERIKALQHKLFRVGTDLATPKDHKDPPAPRISPEDTKWLEAMTDELDARLPELQKFILPGGSPSAAFLHTARTTCRRAERAVVSAKESGEGINDALLPFLNRLSSYLFALARWANWRADVPETHPNYTE